MKKAKYKFDVVMSMGADCACAMYMKKHVLRTFASPFDWLTHADYYTRMELILNDFQYFLDKEYLKQMPKPTQFPADKNNDYYENTKTKLYFWHDFPADKPFESTYPEVKQKYDRRIKRFLEVLNSDKKVLLVYLSHQPINDDNMIFDYCDKLNKKFAADLHFLIIEHTPDMNIGEITKAESPNNIYKYNLYTLASEEHHNLTLGQEKYIREIFKNFALKNPFVKIKKYIVKIICMFIPVRSIRKKIRKVTKVD